MPPTTFINFDGVAQHGNTPVEVPDGYAGFQWDRIGAHFVTNADRDEDTGNGYGFSLELSGGADCAGFTYVGGISSFQSTGETFNLIFMDVAGAYFDGLKVRFTPLHVGETSRPFKIIVDQEFQIVEFPHRFHNIVGITIEVRGGHDANPDDNGASPNLAIGKFAIRMPDARDGDDDGASGALPDWLTALHANAAADQMDALMAEHALLQAPHMDTL